MRKKKKKKKEKKSHKKYLNGLNEDIIKKKNFVDPNEKKKDEVYLYDQREKAKQLEEIKIQTQEKIIAIKKITKNKLRNLKKKKVFI